MLITDNIDELRSSLNDKELSKLQCFQILHKCPWYIKIFKKKPKFKYIQNFDSGIDVKTIMKCKYCKKEFDITDYNRW